MEYASATFEKTIRRRIRLSLRIPERIPIADWLEVNIYLPKDSSRRHGKFKATPYQRDILNDIGDTTLNEIVCMKSIRVGWTQMLALALVYCVRHLGSPALFVTINKEKAIEFVKTFWEPLFAWKHNPNTILKEIRRRYIKGEKQDQWGDWYFLNGGAFRARAAGSDDAFRGFPARYGAADEPDAENWQDKAEGSKIELLRGRTVEFDDGRVILGCSPTNTSTSVVWKYFQRTDMRRRFVPCPHCTGVYDAPMDERDTPAAFKGFQYLKFGDLETKYGVKFDVRNHTVVKAVYRCEDCGEDIEEVTAQGWSWKRWMDRHGRWVPTNGSWLCTDWAANKWEPITETVWEERRDEIVAMWRAEYRSIGRTNAIFTEDEETGEMSPVFTTAVEGKRGYHIWSAYSQLPGITWLRLAQDWLVKKAEGRNGIQSFVNQHLGEPWEPGGLFALPDESELSSWTVPYDAEVPPDVLGIVAGADIQRGSDDGTNMPRVEVSVYGVGRRKTRYLIGHWVIEGAWGSQKVEMALDALITRKFRRADGREFPILMTAIDSGDGAVTQSVYDYCRRRRDWGVVAVKGSKEADGVRKDFGIVSREASTHKDTGDVWYMVSTLNAKDELAYQLDLGPALGGIFFPHSAARMTKFFAGLTAEKAIFVKNTGRTVWKRKGALTGEPLDCYVYASAAWELATRKYTWLKDLDALAEKPQFQAPVEPSLATCDRKVKDCSAQSGMINAVLDLPADARPVALPVKHKKRLKMPVFAGSKQRRGGWGRL